MVRCGLVMVMVAALLGAHRAESQPATAPPSDPFEYVVFGLEQVTIGPRGQADGPIGVNDGAVRLRQGTTVTSTVAADTIRLARRTTAEALFCTIVVSRSDRSCTVFDVPLVPASALGVVQVSTGPGDVTVPRRGSRVPLPPGEYRRIRVGAGSTLTLEGGDYTAESIRLARGATLACVAACRIAVRRELHLGRAARIGPAAGSEPTGVSVRIAVQGENARIALRMGPGVTVTGTLYAPTAHARAGSHLRLDGQVIARTVRIGGRARLALPPAP